MVSPRRLFAFNSEEDPVVVHYHDNLVHKLVPTGGLDDQEGGGKVSYDEEDKL